MSDPSPQRSPFQSLNQAYRKVKPLRSEIQGFAERMLRLIEAQSANLADREGWHENEIRDTLKDLLGPAHYINKKGDIDIVVHEGKSAKTPVAVLIEAKRPERSSEFVKRRGDGATADLNVKAVQELVLYYLRERITEGNLGVKHLVATNGVEWYIFDGVDFDRAFAQDRKLVRDFGDFEARRLVEHKTDFFYREIAAPAIARHVADLPYVYLDLGDYRPALQAAASAAALAEEPTRMVVSLYKLLSATHLIKLPFASDSNTLNRTFYTELLHILGLEEQVVNHKRLIGRKAPSARDEGSLLEATLRELNTANRLLQLNNAREFGESKEEQAYGVALALVITWTNRVLFCKLLEAQLLSYHNGEQAYAFLRSDRIANYDDLYALFFRVLALPLHERSGSVAERFGKVPYLNSSLFERTGLERVLDVSNLSDSEEIPLYAKSVLRKRHEGGNRRTLHYLFDFLDAYDFSNEDADAVQEESKNLINASVLGLIFEKINGYKEGSFYTPGFVTEYMVRETIRPSLVKRFRAATAPDAEVPSLLRPFEDDTFPALVNYCSRLNDPAKLEVAAYIVDTLTVCDPAVGSGHFLVSALNELLSVKSELGLLLDEAGISLANQVHVAVANDDLVVLNRDGTFFQYEPFVAQSDRIQRTLFEQKRRLIEGCLFGVDINPNSVKICRLRLWIELLKHAYYRSDRQLETLPNIDINIKTGNSLVRRFALDADLRQALKKSPKYDIDSYRVAVASYRGARTAVEKRSLLNVIEEIKDSFSMAILETDPKRKELSKARGMLNIFQNKSQIGDLFETLINEEDRSKEEVYRQRVKKLEAEFAAAEAGLFFRDAFEWRFEFPAVLDDDGAFVGFDVVVGNPPYIRQEELGDIKPYLQQQYPEVYRGTADILVYFVHLGLSIAAEGGLFSYIISNKFMRAGYGKELREYLTRFHLRELIDFGDLQVFAEATTYPLIIVAEREAAREVYQAVNVPELVPTGFRQNLLQHRFEGSMASLKSEGWSLTDRASFERMDRLRQLGVPLGKFVEGKIYYGIKTGYNDAFVIDAVTAQRLIDEDGRSEEVIKPFLAGREIKRYVQPGAGKYVLFTRRGIDIKAYPAVKRYLEGYRQQLEPRPKNWSRPNSEWPGRKPGSYNWYELQDSVDYWQEFEKPKLMYQVFQVEPCFAHDANGMLCNNSVWILPNQPLWMAGLLNSKLMWSQISTVCTPIQNGYQLISDYFKNVIIVEPDSSTKERLDRLVRARMGLVVGDLDRMAAVESEIEEVVEALYGVR